MNGIESIEWLGRAEGRKLVAVDSVDDLKQGIPYLHLFRGDDGRWRVTGHGHHAHDNADRMPFVCEYLQRRVLPNLRPQADVQGYYNIELHDSYTYLPRSADDYDNVLVFSKDARHDGPVLIPDPYQMANYGGGGVWNDPFKWENKKDVVVGAYTTTGDRDPVRNERIQTCVWSLRNKDPALSYNLRVTRFAQMDREAALTAVPELRGACAAEPMTREQQARHKFILNIKGNTETWDQAWMLSSRSVVLKKYHRDICWYSVMLHDRVHYVRCYDNDDITRNARYLLSNPREAQAIAENARAFVRRFLVPNDHAALYLTALFEAVPGAA